MNHAKNHRNRKRNGIRTLSDWVGNRPTQPQPQRQGRAMATAREGAASAPVTFEALEQRVLLSAMPLFEADRLCHFEDLPSTAISADLNGNGHLDLVTASESGDTLSVMLGQGNGKFGLEQRLDVGDRPMDVIVADVTDDGHLDLVAANRDSGDVSVLLGNGDGTFEDEQRFDAGGDPLAIYAADVDGDGHLDIVAATRDGYSYSEGAVTVLLGNGDGTFGTATPFTVGGNPTAIAVTDLDGDGHLDIVTANYENNYSGGSVSVLMGEGDGTFTDHQQIDVGTNPVGLAVADLDGDGHVDIVTANTGYYGEPGSVSLLRGNGDGTFADEMRTDVIERPAQMGLADMNGDGNLQVVLAFGSSGYGYYSSQPSTITVLHAQGDGTLDVARRFAAGELSPLMVDLTGDGRLDLLGDTSASSSYSYYGSDVRVLLADPDGTFPALQPIYRIGEGDPAIASGDLTGDGHLDLVTASRYGDSISVLLSTGDGSWAPQEVYDVDGPRAIALADISGDGHLDILAASYDSYSGGGHVLVLLNSGDGTFQDVQTVQVSGTPRVIAAADLDGDGHLDIITANSRYNGELSIAMSNGDGTFAEPHDVSLGIESPRALHVTDLDGDGQLDIAVAGYDLNAGVAVVMGNGDGTFESAQTYSVGAETRVEDLAIADLTGDGHLDLITANYQLDGGGLSVLLNNGDGTFAEALQIATDDTVDALSAADMTGDGHVDIVIAGTSSNSSYTANMVAILPGHGDGTFGVQQRFLPSDSLRDVFLEDVSGDGLPDVVGTFGYGSYSSRDLSIVLARPDGTYPMERVFDIGPDPRGATTADLNGDGHLDLVTVSYHASTVSVLMGNSDGTLGSEQRYDVGIEPQSVTAADVNNNGHLDLVVTNSGDTLSVLLNNGDGTFADQQSVGAGGSSPRDVVAADLNGNGDLDLVVSQLGAGEVGVLMGNGDGTFDPSESLDVGEEPRSLVAADLTGDGNIDLAVTSRYENNVSVFLGNGDGTFAEQQSFDVGRRPTHILAADINGDGILDLATADDGSYDENPSVSVLLGNGDGTFAEVQTTELTNRPDALHLSDLTGDGNLDVVSAYSGYYGNAALSVLPGHGDGTFGHEHRYFIGSPRAVFLEDVQGDGTADLISAVSLGYDHDAATVLLSASPDVPVAHNVAVTVAEDSTFNDHANRIDVLAHAEPTEGEQLVLVGATQPANGEVIIDGNYLLYQPDPDFFGTDVFTYIITDTSDDTPDVTGTVTVTVTEVNDPPITEDMHVSVPEGTRQPDDSVEPTENFAISFGTLLEGDVPGPPNELGQSLTVIGIDTTDDTEGTIVFDEVNQQLLYTPATGFIGTDTFTYTVQDEGTTDGQPDPLTATGTVNVNVTEVNHPPIASDSDFVLITDVADQVINPLVNDVPGPAHEAHQSLAITAINGESQLPLTTAQGGIVSLDNGTLTYTPADGFEGTDTFTYTITDDGTTDGQADPLTATATVTIEVVGLMYTVGDDGPTSLTFQDETDGSQIIVSLTGGGTANILPHGHDLPTELPDGPRPVITGADIGIQSIQLQDATDRTSLTIQTRDTDGLITIDTITGDSPLRQINARDVMLTGGLLLEDAGVADRIQIGALADSAALTLPGDTSRGVNLNLGVVGDEVHLTSGSPLQTLTAVGWAGGSIEAPSVNRINITGDRATEIDGDFRVDLTLTDADASQSLGNARIAGSIGSTWTLAGDAGTIAAGNVTDWALSVGDLNNLRLGQVTGSSVDADDVGVIRAEAWNGGVIEADSLRSLQIHGDRSTEIDGDFTADLALTDADARQTLGNARIAGAITDSKWTIAGATRALVAGDVKDWDLEANDVRVLRLDAVRDSSVTAAELGAVRLVAWEGGAIEAETVRALVVRGDRRLDLDGDFTADLALTDANARQTLGNARILGAVTEAEWTIAGTAGAITIGDVEGWELEVGDLRLLRLGVVAGSHVKADNLGAVRAVAWTGGSIEADTMRALVVRGDRRLDVDGDFTASLTLTDEQARQTLGNARIAGGITDSTWSIAGLAGRIVAGDVSDWSLNAADIRVLRLGAVADTTLEAGEVGVVRAAAWHGGEVEAAAMRSLQIRGDRQLDIDGDFTAGLTLTDEQARQTLGNARILGAVNGTTWSLAGPTGVIAIGEVGGWTLEVGEDLRSLQFGQVADSSVTADNIGILRAIAWDGGDVEAGSIRTIQTRGDHRNDLAGDFTADVSLTGGPAPQVLNNARIAGTLADSQWRLDGNVGMITAAAMHASQLFVGVDSAVDGLPNDRNQFNSEFVLRGVNLRGLGQDSEPAFADSHIAAWNIGRLNLGDLSTDNDDAAFGIAAVELGNTRYIRAATDEPVNLRPNDLADLDVYEDDDFVIRVL